MAHGSIAARRRHFDYAEELLENALALDPADPYLYLTAAEELYERQQRWDDIIHVFRLLPEIDPAREFAMVARSLRQSMLETIIDSDATNAQIYALYHVSDATARHYENELDALPDDDYYGRDRFARSDVNDGFDTFGYQHMNDFDRSGDEELRRFLPSPEQMPAKEPLETMTALTFYPTLPEALTESYTNYNWYEVPLMKEWLGETPKNDGATVIDWNAMRDAQGRMCVPNEKVFDEKGHLKVSLEQLQTLHDALAKEYRTMPAEVREGEKAQEHLYELKGQDQLVREVRKKLGNKFFDFSEFDPELKFPTERDDVLMSHLLRQTMRNEGEEETEEEPRQKAW